MKKEKPIIVLTGPTASGKTAMAHELAKKFSGEIICADSMTVYRGMDIGTDKPTLLIQNSGDKIQKDDGSYLIDDVFYHMLDIVNPDEEFNVALFIPLAKKLIKEIQDRGHIPFIVGGAVMYIDALVYNFSIPDVKPNLRLRKELESQTAKELFEQLCSYDTDCEWTVDQNNKRRLIREIEVFEATGEPLSDQKEHSPLPENVLYLAINRDREELYKEINERVDKMFLAGFVDEVTEIHNTYGETTSTMSAGYRQVIDYLGGNLTLGEAEENTKQAHRNYAKRQLTWLRNNSDVIWIDAISDARELLKAFNKRDKK